VNNRSVAIDIPLFFARVAFFIGPRSSFPFLSLFPFFSLFSLFLHRQARNALPAELSQSSLGSAAGLIGARRAME